MSKSASVLFFFLFTLLLCSHAIVTYKWSKSSLVSAAHSSSNQQSLRHKLNPAQPQQPPEEENLRDFCTLSNFQNCISELWPGAGTGSSSSAQMNPSEANSKKSASSSDNEDSSETTTTSSGTATTSSDLAFPTTFRELQATCSDLKERVRCLDRHSERCFTPEMMQVFGHIVTNAKQFVHDLCDNKRVQSEFLVHAKCFRNISLDEQKCGQEYRDAINIPISESSAPKTAKLLSEHFESLPMAAKLVSAGQQAQEFQIKELIMRRSCCALQELVLCKRRHVREQCGENAAIFMRDHLPRITNPVLEQHCSAYTYGPGTCDEALYRRRVDADGQLVATNPYHNPFDRSPHSAVPSSQHLGGGTNRMTRNQLADAHGNHGTRNQLNAVSTCTLLVLSILTANLLSTFRTQC